MNEKTVIPLAFKDQTEKNWFRNAKVLQLLDIIAAESGKILKTELVHKSMTNVEFRETVYKALNPHIVYFIKKWPEPELCNSQSSYMTLHNAIIRITKHLEDGKTRGDAAIKLILSIMGQLMPDDAEVLSRIIRKDLKAGFGASTVNKTTPGFIPVYPCMLAIKANDKTKKNLMYPCFSQIKADGRRNNLFYNDSNIICKSRSGKPVIVGDYFDFMKDVLKDMPFVLDGELIVLDDQNVPLPRSISNGLVSKWNKGSIPTPNVQFVVWDIIPTADFIAGVWNVPYKDRLKQLNTIVNHINNARITVIETILVRNENELMDSFTKALESGEEGIVAKNLNMIFENKRSKDQLKFKLEAINEMRITGLNPGTGSRLGKLGSFQLESEDGIITVSAGSGLTSDQSEKYWDDNIIGKIVSVKHNGVISNSAGGKSLFLPIFVELRESKTTADIYNEFV